VAIGRVRRRGNVPSRNPPRYLTRIADIGVPISSTIRNACIDFSQMTANVVAMPDVPGIGFEAKNELYKVMKQLVN
jgi:hypothetical protein